MKYINVNEMKTFGIERFIARFSQLYSKFRQLIRRLRKVKVY